MDANSPISEAAGFLGVATAELLLEQPHHLRVLALQAVRKYLCVCEAEGLVEDPITLQADLHTMVLMLIVKAQEAK